MAQLLRRQPRAIAYVSCDAATLARDLKVALEAGWQVAELSAFDLFPGTSHVEVVAIVTPGAPEDSQQI